MRMGISLCFRVSDRRLSARVRTAALGRPAKRNLQSMDRVEPPLITGIVGVMGCYANYRTATRFAAIEARSAMSTHQAAGVRNRVISKSAFRLGTCTCLNHQRRLSAEMDVAAHSSR